MLKEMEHWEWMERKLADGEDYEPQYWVIHLPRPEDRPFSSCRVLNELLLLFHHESDRWDLFMDYANKEHESAITAHAPGDMPAAMTATLFAIRF